MQTLRDFGAFALLLLATWIALAVMAVTAIPFAAYRGWRRLMVVRAYTQPALRRAHRRGW